MKFIDKRKLQKTDYQSNLQVGRLPRSQSKVTAVQYYQPI